jgi:hypothetical protein
MTEAHLSADPAADASQRRAQLLGLIGASWTTQAIAVAAQLGLADLLAHSASTVTALAQATACHAPSLRRLLGALATLDLVVQQGDDEFALTPTGALLRSDTNDSLAAWAQFWGQEAWRLWSELAESVRTGTSARRRAKGSDGFLHLDADRAAADLFNRAMSNLTFSVATRLATSLDFGASGHVVDVGGGQGELLAAVLATHAHLRGTLFDLEHAIAMAGPALAARGVNARCELVVGSFFDRVPAGADDYLLKSVLHDWDDASCVTILRRCRDALTSHHARLIVIERIAPERFSATTRDQAIARSDLNMLVCTGGHERSERQFRALLDTAGLHVMRITALPNEFSAIETGAVAGM